MQGMASRPRLLFIGNSQLGCLKLALDRWPQDLAGYAIDYMPINQLWTADLEVDEGWLRSRSETANRVLVPAPGAKEEVFIPDYHAVVIVGLGATVMHMGLIYHHHRLLMHRGPGKQLLSRAAFDAAAAEVLLRCGARLVAARIREVSVLPTLLVPEPLPSHAITEDGEEWGDAWTGAHVGFLHAAYGRHLNDTFAPLSVDILGQSEQTIVHEYFTNPVHARGAVNIYRPRPRPADGPGHPYKAYRKDDRRHMNEEYGRLAVKGVGAWLRSRLDPAAPSDVSGSRATR